MKTYLETKSIMKLYLLRFPKQAAPSVGTWLMECEKHLLTKDVSWTAQQIRKAEGLHVKKEKNLSWGLFLFSFNSIHLHTCQHNFILYMCKKTCILHFENTIKWIDIRNSGNICTHVIHTVEVDVNDVCVFRERFSPKDVNMSINNAKW